MQAHSCCKTPPEGFLSAHYRQPSPTCTRCQTAFTLFRPPSLVLGSIRTPARSRASARAASCPAAAAKWASNAREWDVSSLRMLFLLPHFSLESTSSQCISRVRCSISITFQAMTLGSAEVLNAWQLRPSCLKCAGGTSLFEICSPFRG